MSRLAHLDEHRNVKKMHRSDALHSLMPAQFCAFSAALPLSHSLRGDYLGAARALAVTRQQRLACLPAHRPLAAALQAQASSLTDGSDTRAERSSSGATVLYFAYGSNLSPKTLGLNASRAARRVDLVSSRRAVLPGHRFAYYPTPIPTEPALATVLPVDDEDESEGSSSVVHGMLYEMKTADFEAVARSEGVLPSFLPQPAGLPFSKVLTVRVQLYADDAGEEDRGMFVLAKTFYWPSVEPLIRVFPDSKPSARYFGLISDGFKHYGLDESFMPAASGGASVGKVFKPDDMSCEGRTDSVTTGAGSPAASRDGKGGKGPLASSSKAVSEAVDAAYDAMRADDEEYTEIEGSDSSAAQEVRFVNLTPASDVVRTEPRSILAYIPGIDGSGFSIISQMPGLLEAEQDIWAVRIPYANRDSWSELARNILNCVAAAVEKSGAPSVVIVGESMGGAVAMQVGVENSRREAPVAIDQLVMVNPASSFRHSELSRLWLELSSRVPPDAYKRLVGPLLVPFILDPTSIPLRELPTTGLKRLEKLRSFLSRAADLLPQGAVMHRLSLLNDFRLSDAEYACIADGAKQIRLLIAENDNLLPVVPESSRLLKLVPGLQRSVFQYGGHAMLQDARVNLGNLLYLEKQEVFAVDVLPEPPAEYSLTSSPLRERVLKARWAAPDKELTLLPTATERATLARKFSTTRNFHSPVVVGTERLPSREHSRPVLFISNHTLIGSIDAVLLMQHVLEHRNVLVRSLAHPVLFRAFGMSGESDETDTGKSASSDDEPRVLRLPGLDGVTTDELKRFGIMSINPRALVRELAQNSWVLLFPGGAREALKRKSDDLYSLHWPESTEFVRVAASMGATIIPVATVGTEDSVNLLLDSAQVSKGARALSSLRRSPPAAAASNGRGSPLPAARQWRGTRIEDESGSMLPPLAIPSAPDRVYLKFGPLIEVPAAARDDRELAREIYGTVKTAVKDGIDSLLERRELDCYRTPRSRLAFRLKHGNGVGPPASPAWTWETAAGPVDD